MPISRIPGVGLDTGSSGVAQSNLATGVAGTGPAFSAYASAGTSISNATYTKVLFATELFDTNSNFASSTFTPTVAGYYQINASIRYPVTSGTLLALYKNGSLYCSVSSDGTSGVLDANGNIAALIYCNGSTDYIEVYGYSNGNGTITVSTGTTTQFSGAMVRAA
jgi:3',5'-cyclic AMP phosphodiesterase CpdA